MTGIDAATGKALGGIAHLRQSVRDILETPLGSRVLLRDYGSRLFELIDRPATPELLASVQAEAAAALARFEPRLQLRRIRAESVSGGHVALSLEGIHLPSAEPVRLELAEVAAAAPAPRAAPAIPAPAYAGPARLDSIPPLAGEIVRALVHPAGETWYSRRAGARDGSYEGDLRINANLEIDRLQWLPPDGIRVNAPPGPPADANEPNGLDTFFGAGGPGESMALWFLWEGLGAPIAVPVAGRATGSGTGYLRLDTDLAETSVDDASSALLAAIATDLPDFNFVIAEAA